MILDYIFVLLAFCFLMLPGFLLGIALLRRVFGLFGSMTIGAGLGIVLLLDMDALISAVSVIDGVKLALAIGLAASISLMLVYRNIGFTGFKQRLPWAMIFIIAAGAAIRSLPLLLTEYPLGWDTTFHLLIARAITFSGEIPQTWMPFEQFPLNYPLGSHMLVANLNLVTGVPLHTVFAACVTMIFSALTISAVYIVAGSLGYSSPAKTGSAFAYAFLANAGSIDYFRWGGLPNQAAMFLFICAVAVFTGPSESRMKRLLVSGYLLSGVVLVHHHSMLAAFIILLFIALIACLARLKICGVGIDAVGVIIIALAASSFQSWKLFARATEASQTGVLKFKETLNVFETPFIDGGVVLIIAAVLGFSYIFRDKEDGLLFLHGWTTALFAAFTLGYYVWRVYSKIFMEDVYVAMTPSRFLTDMAYPLSLYAGIFLSRLFAHRLDFRKAATICVLLLIPFYYISGQLRPPLSDNEIEAIQWLKAGTNASDIVINEGPARYWVPYISDREVSLTPIPISEHEDRRKEDKILINDCVQGKKSPEDCKEALRRFEVEDFYLFTPEKKDSRYLSEVFANEAVHIYYVDKAGLDPGTGGSR